MRRKRRSEVKRRRGERGMAWMRADGVSVRRRWCVVALEARTQEDLEAGRQRLHTQYKLQLGNTHAQAHTHTCTHAHTMETHIHTKSQHKLIITHTYSRTFC